MGTNSQSRAPPPAETGTQWFRDQRTELTRTTGEAGPHRREKEKERHIETGTTRATDRQVMTAAAAVRIEAVTEAVYQAKAAAREGIDHRTMEAHPVEK